MNPTKTDKIFTLTPRQQEILRQKRLSITRRAQQRYRTRNQTAGPEVHTDQIVDLIKKYGKVNRRMVGGLLGLDKDSIDHAIRYGTSNGKFKTSQEKANHPKGGGRTGTWFIPTST